MIFFIRFFLIVFETYFVYLNIFQWFFLIKLILMRTIGNIHFCSLHNVCRLHTYMHTYKHVVRVIQNFNFWQITKNFKNSKHHADTLFFHNFHGNIQHISTALFNKKRKIQISFTLFNNFAWSKKKKKKIHLIFRN